MSNTLATHHTGTTAHETPVVAAGPSNGAGYGPKVAGPTATGATYWNLSGDPDFVAEPGFPTYNRRIANPGPLGMFAQAVSLFLWGLYLVRARGITETSFFVGMALAVGGIVQFLAGMWEFRTGNTFAATQFSMFGGFWFAVGLNYIPGTSGTSAYAVSDSDIFGSGGQFEFHQAVGCFWLVWFLFSFMLWLASFRSSLVLSFKLFLTWLMFLLLMSGEFTGRYGIIKAGGGISITAAWFAFYQATAALMTHETSAYPMHRYLGEFPKRQGAGVNRY